MTLQSYLSSHWHIISSVVSSSTLVSYYVTFTELVYQSLVDES